MVIRDIYVQSFGALENRRFSLSEGMNLIYGLNESGKTSLAHFLRFMFYGVGESRKLFDKNRFINWNTGIAAGNIEIEKDGVLYRIERSIRSGETKEKGQIVNLSTGMAMPSDVQAGIFFFGMPESEFLHSVFVDQLGGATLETKELTETIENLLITGNEEANIQNALKKLRDARRKLQHQRGVGGALPDAQHELFEVQRKLEESKVNAKEIQDIQDNLVRLNEQLETKKKQNEVAKKQYEAYGLVEEKRTLQKWRDTQALAEERKKQLAEEPDGNLNRPLLAKLEQLDQSLARFERDIEAKEQGIQRIDRALSQMPTDDYSEADVELCAKKARRWTRKRKVYKVLSVISLLLAVLAGAVAALSYLEIFLPAYTLYLAAGTAGLVVLSILFAIISAAKKRKIGRFQKEWQLDSEPSGWTETMNAKKETSIERKETEASREAETISLRGLESQKQDLIDMIRTETGAIGCEAEDPEEALTSARVKVVAACEKREALQAECTRLDVECRILGTQFDGVDIETREQEIDERLKSPEGELALGLSREEAAKLKQTLGFYENNLPLHMNMIVDKERELAAKTATFVSPSVLETQKDYLEKETADLQLRTDAVDLAMAQITAASENIRKNILPRVATVAGRYLKSFSDGKYEMLGTDENWQLSYFDGQETHSVDVLSGGTKELVYLCIRLAILAVLEQTEEPLVIFDEAFASVDDERLNSVFAFFEKNPMSQVISFSCRVAEKQAALVTGAKIINL